MCNCLGSKLEHFENDLHFCQGTVTLRLLFVLAAEPTLLRMFLNIWRQILFPGDLLFRISVQMNVELLIAHAVCNSQHA